MKKRFLAILSLVLMLAVSLAACGKAPAPKETFTDGDAIEQAIYNYLVEEVGKTYDKADATIPTMNILSTEVGADGNITVYGDFWVENYNIQGDTLFCESGGHYPGVFQIKQDGDTYTVTKFENPEDGADFTPTAKKLFGEHYKDWQKVSSDDKARAELRTKTVAEYVKQNKLDVTQYQDYGWDPVPLDFE